MNETTKKYLSSIGVDASTIAALEAETIPDDFNIEESAKAYISKRRELVLNDGDLQKEMKKKYNAELYPAMMKPILKEVQKLTGLSSEQLKAITPDGQSLPDMKKAIALGIDTFSKTAAGGVDEVKKQLFEIQSKYETAQNEFKAEKENLILGFQKERKNDKVKRHFERSIAGLELTVPSNAANTLLSTDLMNSYNFDVNDKGELQIFTKEGNRVEDGKNFLSAADVIKRRAEEFQILKKSNGGGQPNDTPKATIVRKEGESDAVRRMREAANRNRR